MKHRLIEKIADGLSSGRLRTVGRRAAGRLFALTMFGLAAAAAAPVTAMAALDASQEADGVSVVSDGKDGLEYTVESNEEADLQYTVKEITGGGMPTMP